MIFTGNFISCAVREKNETADNSNMRAALQQAITFI